ncbi:MAG: hypothetical protein ACRESR_04415 [Gammaproteobacteria bacterium]
MMKCMQENRRFLPRRAAAIAACLIAAGFLCGRALAASNTEPPPPYSKPYLPTRDSQVLQRYLPKESNPEVRKMHALQAKLAAHPHDLKTALALSRLYVTYGRGLGDAHYAGYAFSTIAPWMHENPPPPKAMVMHATILQYLHKFKAAQVELKAALARNPHLSNGWLTRAFTGLVQGQYGLTNNACVNLTSTGGPFLGLICTATLRSYTGRAKQGYDILKMDQGGGPKVPDSIKAWIQGLLAFSAQRLNEPKEVNLHYKKALSYLPTDNFLLVNYSDFLLDQHRPREVIKLLHGHTTSDTAFLRLALAEQAIHSPDLARYTWIMAARFAALQMRGDHIYAREQARFTLYMQHDPQGALKLAVRNWKVQRAPKDIRVYFEAALAAHKPAAAKPVLAFLAKSKLQGPVINRLAKKARAELAQQEVAQK